MPVGKDKLSLHSDGIKSALAEMVRNRVLLCSRPLKDDRSNGESFIQFYYVFSE